MSPWEQKAEQLGVEYMPSIPPNHGPTDRAHFNYQGFVDDAARIEAEATSLRMQVGVAAYEPVPRHSEQPAEPEKKGPAADPVRQEKLEKASQFLASIEDIVPLAG
jgi:hypothetical protein